MNNLPDLEASWGETLPVLIEIDTDLALTATITITSEDGTFRFAKSGSFINKGVDLSFIPSETELEVGEYNYQLRIDYTAGRVDKFPDSENCCNDSDDDELEEFKFPKLKITPSLDMPEIVS